VDCRDRHYVFGDRRHDVVRVSPARTPENMDEAAPSRALQRSKIGITMSEFTSRPARNVNRTLLESVPVIV
jgi:hypothetical protein